MAVIHGHRGPVRSGTYNSWRAMRQRCGDPRRRTYVGVEFDPSWHSFEGFLFDMGERPLGCDLSRRDHSLPYCMLNCEWVPMEHNRGRHG